MVAPLEYQPQFRLAASIIAANNHLDNRTFYWHLKSREWAKHDAERGKKKATVKQSPLHMAILLAAAINTR